MKETLGIKNKDKFALLAILWEGMAREIASLLKDEPTTPVNIARAIRHQVEIARCALDDYDPSDPSETSEPNTPADAQQQRSRVVHGEIARDIEAVLDNYEQASPIAIQHLLRLSRNALADEVDKPKL